MSTSRPLLVFVSYAAADSQYLTELEKHTRLLQSSGTIQLWGRYMLCPGDDSEAKVSQALAAADVFLLLCSSDYFAVNGCNDGELRHALDRIKSNERRPIILPIILRACMLPQELLGRVLLPNDGKPLAMHHDRDAAWTELAINLAKFKKHHELDIDWNRRAISVPSKSASKEQFKLKINPVLVCAGISIFCNSQTYTLSSEQHISQELHESQRQAIAAKSASAEFNIQPIKKSSLTTQVKKHTAPASTTTLHRKQGANNPIAQSPDGFTEQAVMNVENSEYDKWLLHITKR